MQAGFDCGDGHPEDIGNFLPSKALDIGQDEDLAAVASDYQEKSEEAERIMVARGVLPPEM